MPLPSDPPSDKRRFAKLDEPQHRAVDVAESSPAPLAVDISLRRGRFGLLLTFATVVVVFLTLFLLRGAELTRFNRHNVDAAEEKELLDRYNSYSGNVASALGRPLEMFVGMMAQILVLWLLTDSVLAVKTRWRVQLFVSALGLSIAFLLNNSLNALNVQVRELPPTLIMTSSDLSIGSNTTSSSTVEKSFSERTPQNPTVNTILRSLVLPRTTAQSNCNVTGVGASQIFSTRDDTIAFGMPQRAWMLSFLPEALSVSTIRFDLLSNKTTDGSTTVSDLQTNASTIADLLISAVITNSTYAPFDAVTPFNLARGAPNNTAAYPKDPSGGNIIPTARLAGLLPPDPTSSESQDRAWLLARIPEFVRRATSNDWQNSSALQHWTLDVTRVNITPNVWVDAVTIESEVLTDDRTLRAGVFEDETDRLGTTTGLKVLEADGRVPDAQIHAYAVCLNANGSESLSSFSWNTRLAADSRIVCPRKSKTLMYVFSSGRHVVADRIDYRFTSDGSFEEQIRTPRIVASATFARISWQFHDLSTA